MWYVLKVLE